MLKTIIFFGLCSTLIFSQAISAPATKTSICPIVTKSRSLPKGFQYASVLPHRDMSADEIKEVERTRACLITYSSGFPGGEAAFLKAKPDDLSRDLKTVEELFNTPKATLELSIQDPNRGTDPQIKRKAHIYLGWDRTQVLLWGHFFLERALEKAGAYDAALADISLMRKEFGLTPKRLESWNKAERDTYFSVQALRNMITALEYRARAEVAKDAAAQSTIAGQYFADYPAISPHFGTSGDPTEAVLGEYCSGNLPTGLLVK